ncbi:p360 18R [African swine fever virus]|uniref:p360 18R n=1 Tax=African swine fever virus TaxID=10497 RepID=A0A894KTT3_ASF|nr:p360 18R [African swine fever virus]
MQNTIPNFILFFFFLYRMLQILLATLLRVLQRLRVLTPQQRAVAFFRANTMELQDFLCSDGQSVEILSGPLLIRLLQPSGPLVILSGYHLFRQNPKAGQLRGLVVKMLVRLYDAIIYNILSRLRPAKVRNKAIVLYWVFRAIHICHAPLLLHIVRYVEPDFAVLAFICAAYFGVPQVLYLLYKYMPLSRAVLTDAIRICLASINQVRICYAYLLGGSLKGLLSAPLRIRLRAKLRSQRKKKDVLSPHD